MDCTKQKTIFDFYEVSTCDNCRYHLADYDFLIGNCTIFVYYLKNCYLDKDVNVFLSSKKAKLFFKDMIYNEGTFLIIEEYNLNKLMDDIEVLVEFKDNIHILII